MPHDRNRLKIACYTYLVFKKKNGYQKQRLIPTAIFITRPEQNGKQDYVPVNFCFKRACGSEDIMQI